MRFPSDVALGEFCSQVNASFFLTLTLARCRSKSNPDCFIFLSQAYTCSLVTGRNRIPGILCITDLRVYFLACPNSVELNPSEEESLLKSSPSKERDLLQSSGAVVCDRIRTSSTAMNQETLRDIAVRLTDLIFVTLDPAIDPEAKASDRLRMCFKGKAQGEVFTNFR